MKRSLTLLGMLAFALSAAVFSLAAPSPSWAQGQPGEIGYVEDIALAKDRAAAIEKLLIPGAADDYYYRCLLHQAAGDLAKVDELLKPWIARHPGDSRQREIECRQALLAYDKDPKRSLAFIRRELGLLFNHQRELVAAEIKLPNALDEKLISRDKLANLALTRHTNLQGFEDSALDWLADEKLTDERLRDLLARLNWPALKDADLPQLIVEDLGHPNSGGFGSLNIHRLLTLAQLDELLKGKPALLNETPFIQAYLGRLRPADDVNYRYDKKEQQAHLDRLWAFVQKLSPGQNSLKANVLYHRLVLDRSLGVYDHERFVAYLKLPRLVSYVNPKYLEIEDNRRWPANLQAAEFAGTTGLPPIMNDEPLVRSYLMHFLAPLDAADSKEFAPYIESEYLKHVFAEAKIVNGVGDQEKDARDLDRLRLNKRSEQAGIVEPQAVKEEQDYYSLLPAAMYQALRDRVDLDFAFTNKTMFAADEPVSLDLFVKNVPTLIVKVYEVNALNYYRDKLREVDTDIMLDGLVANDEQVLTLKDPPLKRTKMPFKFDKLDKRGTYVIEFIGGGKSSRALVRKGDLHFLVRTSVAGYVFTVLDDANKPVANPTIYLGGQKYSADKDASDRDRSRFRGAGAEASDVKTQAVKEGGHVTIPFSNQPQSQPIILADGEFAALANFQHGAESYALAAGFHVDRESLLKDKKATLIVRPTLTLNGTPVTLSVLEDVRLTLTSTNLDGVQSSKEIGDFKLSEGQETTYEIQVPERLAGLSFTLSAKVQNLSQAKKDTLTASDSVALNGIDRTDKIEDLHLIHADGKYFIDVLGRTGEPKPRRAVQLALKHKDFREPVNVTLLTDDAGRVALGPLADIAAVTATGPEGAARSWIPAQDGCVYPSVIHGQAGMTLQVPFMPRADKKSEKPQRAELSLLEKRGGQFYADRFDALSIRDGLLAIDTEKLPAGDYELLIKAINRRIQIRIAEGVAVGGYVLGAARGLQVIDARPLQIASVEADKDAVRIKLANANKYARVHVVATRYAPDYPLFGDLSKGLTNPAMMVPSQRESVYLAGRSIGDEYRYVLDRKYAAKFVGNMLGRPGLLLNPWAIRKTETGVQAPAEGLEYVGSGGGRGGRFYGVGAPGRPPGHGAAGGAGWSNLDFLAETSVVLTNLRPDEKGVVTVSRKDLGWHQQIHVLAVDPDSTVYRELSLPEGKPELLDLRLARGLDPKAHLTEQKQITAIRAGDKKVSDLHRSRFRNAGEQANLVKTQADKEEGLFVIEDIATSSFEAYDSLPRVYRLYATLSSNPTLAEFSFILDWPRLKPEEKQAKYSEFACHELNFFLFKKDPEFFKAVVQPYLRNKKDKTFMDHWLLGDDLAAYRQTWNFRQLNTVEQILLGQRLVSERASVGRHVRDLFDLLPPNIEQFNRLFQTALMGSALETGDYYGFRDAARKAARPATQPELGEIREAMGPVVTRANGTLAIPPGGPAATAAPGLSPPPAPAAKPESAPLAENAKRAAAPTGRLRQAGEKAGADTDLELDALSLGVMVDRLDQDKVGKELALRREVRQLYRKLDKTEEFVENNYYHLPIEQANAGLITVNAMWRDYAAWAAADNPHPALSQGERGNRRAGDFLSTNFAEAHRSFAEMMFALAVLDLPFQAGKTQTETKDGRFTLSADQPMVIFSKQIFQAPAGEGSQPGAAVPQQPGAAVPQQPGAAKTPILVSQNFFQANDRYLFVNGERIDKYVTDEFLTHVVYGCQAVVTNPTSSRQKLELLLQVPRGSIVVAGGQPTRGVTVDLEPYATQKFEYFFYFPFKGQFVHYPVHVAKNGKLVAFAPAATFNVVETPTRIDTSSWQYISQRGSDDDVLKYLADNNIDRLNLEKIAFRMKDKAFFAKTIALLDGRHVYNQTLWSYSVLHDDVPVMRQFLQHCDSFLAQCGDYIDCTLVTIDPVIRKSYQHMEYSPLVNARAHRLGKRWTILNDRLAQQYARLMKVLCYRSEKQLDNDDLMAVTYYLLLQDRVEEALEFFKRVDAKKLETQLQYDYFAAYVAFYKETPAAARDIALKYREYGVDRWRKLFANVLAQADEIEGKAATTAADEKDRTQLQTRLAAGEPAIDLKLEGAKAVLSYQSVAAVTVNYYLMDIELMFSRNPFVGSEKFAEQFAYIRPNLTETIKLPADKAAHEFELPKKFTSSNVLVEVVAGGMKKSAVYFSNVLAAAVTENYGQLKVTRLDGGRPLAKVYVKVYVRTNDGQVVFYKDGYTDLRGRFDYTSLNTNELDRVEKFSILVLSETDGAVIREAGVPKR